MVLATVNSANADEDADKAIVDALPALVDDLLKQGTAKLVNANTGAGPDLQGLATSLNDLVPDFKISINGDDVSSDSLSSLGFTYSPRLDRVADIGLSVLFDTPKTNSVFEEQGLIAAEQAAALGETLKFGDSTEVKLTVSRLGKFLGKRYGRSLKDYQDVMETLLDIGLASAADQKLEIEALQDDQFKIRSDINGVCRTVREALEKAIEDGAVTREAFEFVLQSAIKAAKTANANLETSSCETAATRLIDNQLKLKSVSEAYVKDLEYSLTRMGLFALPELIEQQPQLQLIAGYKDNHELAGPDEFSVALSWEIPLGKNSVNDLIFSDAWQDCSQRKAGTGFGCVQKLNQALDQTMLGEGPTKSQFRFSLSAEYLRRDDYSVEMVDPMFSYELAGEDAVSIAGSLYWKRYMSDVDNEPYVFEATLVYESNDSDMRNDRGLFGLTASRNISSGLALSLGLVWANRPEFRGDVDQDLTAKLGLNYKLSPR